MASSIWKYSALLASISSCLFMTSAAYSQTSETLPYSSTVEELDGKVVRSISDNTDQTASQVWVYEANEADSSFLIDGPREDAADLVSVRHSDDGLLKVVSNALGHETHFRYDSELRLISVTDPNGAETTIEYGVNEGSNPTAVNVQAPNGDAARTKFYYNADGSYKDILLPSGKLLSAQVSSDGSRKPIVENVLNELRRLLSSDQIDNFYPRQNPDNSEAILNSLYNGDEASLDYNEIEQVIGMVSLDGTRLNFEYDMFGNLSKVSDGRGVVTTYLYDGYGNVVSENSRERGLTTYKYDAAGNMLRRIQAGNLVTNRKFDLLNRVTKEVMRENGEDKIVNRYVYDNCENGVGRMCKIISDGDVTKFDYNIRGQYSRVKVTYPDSGLVETTHYKYGSYGQLLEVRYPSGLAVSYSYRDDGSVKRVDGKYDGVDGRESFNIARGIKFDSNNNRMTRLVHGNGLVSTNSYDAEDRISQIKLKDNQSLLDSSGYTFDNQGNISGILKNDDSKSSTFSYDVEGRLIEEVVGSGSQPTTYRYDDSWNRVARQKNDRQQLYSYSPDNNRLAKVNGQELSYDVRGNLLEDRNGKREFSYNATNRLTGFYKNGTLKASYTYNAIGQRVQKTLHDGAQGEGNYKVLNATYSPEGWLLSETGYRNEQRKFARDYVWLEGRPLAQIERRFKNNGNSKTAHVTYIHTDHLNTPRSASDDAGQIVWRWDSSAFGQGKANRDVDGDGNKTVIRLRFSGQYFDRESGLFYNNQRDYDPNLGRYIQSDPIGLKGGISRYSYALGNPISFTDPSGLKTCTGSRIRRAESYNCGNLGATCYGNCSGFNGTSVSLNLGGAGSGGGGGSVSSDGETRIAVQTGGSCNSSGCTATGQRFIIRNTVTTNINYGSLFGSNLTFGQGYTLCADAGGVCVPPAVLPELGANGLPCASNFFDAYDDLSYAGNTDEDVGLLIGGNVNLDVVGRDINTCSLRVSCALNASGLIIPSISGQSTLIQGGSNAGTRALYDTVDLHAFLSSITPPNATNQSTRSTRARLGIGQIAITIRPREFTVDSAGNETTTRSGHAGVVVDPSRTYTDPNIPTSENDIWILDTCTGN